MGIDEPGLRFSWLASERPVPRLIARPLVRFLHTEAAGGILLLAATLLALGLANSPFGEAYEAIWKSELSISLGPLSFSEDLRHFVNDALMAIFFFVVGLEIKRELVVGELSDMRKAALPALGAVGGMVLPAVLYYAVTRGGPADDGWGIPMATDIAFAVGLLALFSKRIPSGLKVFLLSLAIVDDIGAILVIAVFYSSAISFGWLSASFLLLGVVIALRKLKIWWVPVYAVIGVGVWVTMYESGVHATIAGVALGLLTPARPTDPRGITDVLEQATTLATDPDASVVRATTQQANEVVSVAERLEHLLHPWTSYVIIPIFALANAGVILSSERLREAVTSEISLGIVLGLVVGKVVGITGTCAIAMKMRVASAPEGVTKRHILAVSAVAGIGFTVSLFIAGLAFEDPQLVETAKIGVFLASLLAGALGTFLLFFSRADSDSGSTIPGEEG